MQGRSPRSCCCRSFRSPRELGGPPCAPGPVAPTTQHRVRDLQKVQPRPRLQVRLSVLRRAHPRAWGGARGWRGWQGTHLCAPGAVWGDPGISLLGREIGACRRVGGVQGVLLDQVGNTSWTFFSGKGRAGPVLESRARARTGAHCPDAVSWTPFASSGT